MSTLADWAKNNIENYEGGASKKAPKTKLTDKKVKVGNVERTVRVGPRGGKYVMVNGKKVSLSTVQQAKKK